MSNGVKPTQVERLGAAATALSGATGSKTTQNVGIGTFAGGGSVAAVVSLARLMFGDRLFYPPEADAPLAIVVSTIVIPYVSRAIAMWRDPAKAAS